MDERVREHARILVEWSARVERGDSVVMSVDEDAHELAVAVAEQLGAVDADLAATYGSGEVARAYLKGHEEAHAGEADGSEANDEEADDGEANDGEADGSEAHVGEFGPHEHRLALIEAADVFLSLRGGRNTSAMADVDGETRQAYATATDALTEARMATDWVATVHPNRSLAQQAGMAFEEYQDFAYDAIIRDWEALADEMAELTDVLDAGSEVRITTAETDLTMSIENRVAVNSAASVAYDSHNLPSGEVFTAPVADSVEGHVLFDVPMTINGRRVRDVRLTFEGGEVVAFSAETNEDVLADVLDTDRGARRLGELGIGMNRGIDRFTDSILFDEKMGDTVHLAVGRAYASNFPPGHEDERNDSAVHVDMITDVRENSSIEVDGEVVQRDGTFRWETGFDE